METYRAELHVHTVLSPCAEVEMIPPLIVREALDRGLRIIAVTDHNASANVAAVQKAAAGTNLTVLPGMELQTREDVHSLCLFDTLERLQTFQAVVDASLPEINNRPDYFGEQFVVDETGDFIRRDPRLLISSVSLSLTQAWQLVTDLGGLFIPAHINRQAFGLIPTLGLIPGDIRLEALEISRHIQPDDALRKFPQISGYPLIQSGDVHRLDDFLGAIEFLIQSPSLAELRLALRGEQARSFQILSKSQYST